MFRATIYEKIERKERKVRLSLYAKEKLDQLQFLESWEFNSLHIQAMYAPFFRSFCDFCSHHAICMYVLLQHTQNLSGDKNASIYKLINEQNAGFSLLRECKVTKRKHFLLVRKPSNDKLNGKRLDFSSFGNIDLAELSIIINIMVDVEWNDWMKWRLKMQTLHRNWNKYHPKLLQLHLIEFCIDSDSDSDTDELKIAVQLICDHSDMTIFQQILNRGRTNGDIFSSYLIQFLNTIKCNSNIEQTMHCLVVSSSLNNVESTFCKFQFSFDSSECSTIGQPHNFMCYQFLRRFYWAIFRY